MVEYTLLLTLIFSFLVQTSTFQTWLAKIAASYLSGELQTTVTIDKFEIQFFKSVNLQGFYLEDQAGDTLVYTESLGLEVADYSLKRNEFNLSEVSLLNPRIRLEQSEGKEELNLQFVLDYFASDEPDTTESDQIITIASLRLKNAHLTYDIADKPRASVGIDFDHLGVKGLSTEISDISIDGDFTSMVINSLSFAEQSGFLVKNLRTVAHITPTGLTFEHLSIRANRTFLLLDYLEFNVDSFADFDDFEELVRIKAGFKENSVVQMADIAWFAHELWGIEQQVYFKGNIRGTIANLRSKDLEISIGENTLLRADLNLNGLPDINKTLIHLSIDELKTTKDDLERIRIPPFDEMNFLALPANYALLGEIEFNGSLDGFVDDFVAYGELRSALGNAQTDLEFKANELTGGVGYRGRLSTQQFNIGKLGGEPMLGSITADLVIDTAYGANYKIFHTAMQGKIHSLGLMGYNYSNITLNGTLELDRFRGKVDVNDPNLLLSYNGLIDLSKKVPSYDFELDIFQANVVRLGLLELEDRYASLCGKISLKCSGDSPDNFRGRVEFEALTLYENGVSHDFGNGFIISTEQDGILDLTIRTDMLDMGIKGTYNFRNLPGSMQFMASGIMPALFPIDNIRTIDSKEVFDLWVQIKNLDPILTLVDKDLRVSKGGDIQAQYNSVYDEMLVRADIPYIYYGDIKAHNIHIDAEKAADLVILNAKTTRLELADSVYLDKLLISLFPYQDNIDAAVKWNNDTINWGDINLSARVLSPENMEFQIRRSSFSVDSMLWSISQRANVLMNGKEFRFDALTLNSSGRSICLDGYVSDNPAKVLGISVQDFELDIFNAMLPEETQIHGVLNGDASIYDVYGSVGFSSEMEVSNFILNQYELGNLLLNNELDSSGNFIRVAGTLVHQNKEAIELKGRYFPKREGNELNITCHFNETDLSPLNSFLPRDDFSELYGTATGKVMVRGSILGPQLQGELDFKHTEVKVVYLNTKYVFDGKMEIFPDMLTMTNVPVKYRGFITNGKRQKGRMGLQLTHNDFQDFSYDLTLDFENFLLMNTRYDQNPYFYGRAFGSGYMNFWGYNDEMEITVNAKTESGTNVFLPLYGATDVALQDFVTFVNHEDADTTDQHTVDLTGISLKLELDVTPEANVEIQFDPTIGDVITGNVQGHLSMGIDPLGYFSIYGGLEVVRGDYLFTMYNIINKRFSIKPGGTIKWETGDPYLADVDLSAIYNLKTSLRDLMVEDAEKYRDIVPVNCYMNLKHELFNPDVSFDIQVPKADGNVEGALNRIRNDPDELYKQMFSLLIINKFSSPGVGGSGFSMGGSALTNTTVEMLNNQLSNWLSGISNEFDLGFKYQPGDAISNEEVALAFGTQLLNDRLILTGNFGVSYGSRNAQNPNHMIGDFSAEYVIDEHTRVRMFNKSNDFDATRQFQAPYTQGFGVFYRKDFDKFKEISWVNKLLGGNKQKKNAVPDNQPIVAPEEKVPEEGTDNETVSTISSP